MTLFHAAQWMILTKEGHPVGMADRELDAQTSVRDWNAWRPERAPHRYVPADLYWRDEQP
tara:strand:- start:878 stop:1057 length:180 start_codon:yes stop_codon:yes gene_type:complete